MQGMSDFIPTSTKIYYINKLLKVGFDTIDAGSFVSPKAVPQMKDTHELIKNIDLDGSQTKILTIIANHRGIEEALPYEQISYLGFPLSLSETFQQRNTNKSIEEAFEVIAKGNNLLQKTDKKMVVYLSMGFGNPYGDPYSPEYIEKFVSKLASIGISIISLSDTIGVSTPSIIKDLFGEVLTGFPAIEFGAHFHSHPTRTLEKLDAAYEAGCFRFDSAINGYGGCPMADDKLVGNLSTQQVIQFFQDKNVNLNIDTLALSEAVNEASIIFPLS